jgi:hypothetical protein
MKIAKIQQIHMSMDFFHVRGNFSMPMDRIYVSTHKTCHWTDLCPLDRQDPIVLVFCR